MGSLESTKVLNTKKCHDNNNINRRVFLNLQQAFDTLDHVRLRNKLKYSITKLEVKKGSLLKTLYITKGLHLRSKVS